MDLGYFGEENLNLPSQKDNTFIGIGHSLGLIKLASLNVKFKALIGIQAFVKFLGFDSQLHRERELELKTMMRNFKISSIDTMISFYKRCGINLRNNYSFSHLNKVKLMQDLKLLTTTHELPRMPLLILGATDDTIVPPRLIYDNFGSDVIMHNKGHHSLGLLEHRFVYEQIVNFLNGITEKIHTG
ncbi:hypothetical protein [Wolbachia endosymbiont of Ctenocephalides felis wCfeT]|uniref:hypothetical protein n=1 Tax=Wolbachia endosymbiont of Ctenocephalides felis wCfeT TaxID=2732593 RepID=UPI001445DA90|nr:hypothetical protein [Wolbachia endosymbiont of Ctenocephalides felis wCfeT]